MNKMMKRASMDKMDRASSDPESNVEVENENNQRQSCFNKCLHFDFVNDCLPEFCVTNPKWVKCRKIAKYIYVIGVIVIGFLLAALQQVSDPIDDWIDAQQEVILRFLIDDKAIYIILVLIVITFLKAMGVKDVLGLRTISVVILAYRIVKDPPAATLFVAMFIIGILSSVSKLIEYQVIGYELQVVQGTPVEFVFKYMRMLLMCCMKGKTEEEKEEKLEWLDPKWTFEISEVSRYDKSMDVMHNIECVMRDVVSKCQCCNKCADNGDIDCSDLEMQHQNGTPQKESPSNGKTSSNGTRSTPRKPSNGQAENLESEPSTPRESDADSHKEGKIKRFIWKTIYFIISVVWTSASEWIQPITELFLFAHNWDFSIMNASIIVLSEFADIDKAVEAWFLITELGQGTDIITAKAKALLSKAAFWALGYCVILPPTLFWAYRYHYIHKDRIFQKRKELGLISKDDEFSHNNSTQILPDSSNDTTTNTETDINGSNGSYTV